jgi:hypothetical protein
VTFIIYGAADHFRRCIYLQEILKYICIKNILPKASIESFDASILSRLAKLDELEIKGLRKARGKMEFVKFIKKHKFDSKQDWSYEKELAIIRLAG